MALLQHDIEGNSWFNNPLSGVKRGLQGHLPSGPAFPGFRKPSDVDKKSLNALKDLDKGKFGKDTMKYQKTDLRTQLSTNQFIQRSFKIEKNYFTKATKYIDDEKKTARSRVRREDKWYKEDDKNTRLVRRHYIVTEKWQKELLKSSKQDDKLMKELVKDTRHIRHDTNAQKHAAQAGTIMKMLGGLSHLAALPLLLGGRVAGGLLGGLVRGRGRRGPMQGPATWYDSRRQAAQEAAGGGPNKPFMNQAPATGPSQRQQNRSQQQAQRKLDKYEYKERIAGLNERISESKSGPLGIGDIFQSPYKKAERERARQEKSHIKEMNKRGFSMGDIADLTDQGHDLQSMVADPNLDKRSAVKRGASKVGRGIGKVAMSPFHPIKTMKGVGKAAGGMLRGIGKVGALAGKFAPLLGVGIEGALSAKSFSEGDMFKGVTHAIGGAASIIPGLGPVVGTILDVVSDMVPKEWQESFNKWAGPAFKKIWGKIAGPGSFLEYLGGIFSDAGKTLVAGWEFFKNTFFSDTAIGFYKKIGKFFLAFNVTIPFKTVKGFFEFLGSVAQGENVGESFIKAFKPVWDDFAENVAPLLVAIVKDTFELVKTGINKVAVGVLGYTIAKKLGLDVSQMDAEERLKEAQVKKSTLVRNMGEEQAKAAQGQKILTGGFTDRVNKMKEDAQTAMEQNSPGTKLESWILDDVLSGKLKTADIKKLHYPEEVKRKLFQLSGIAASYQKEQESVKTANAAVDPEKYKGAIAAADKEVADAQAAVNTQQQTAYQAELARYNERMKQTKALKEKEKKVTKTETETKDAEEKSAEAQGDQAKAETSLAEKASKFLSQVASIFKIGGSNANFGDLILGQSGLGGLAVGLTSMFGGGGEGGSGGMFGGAGGLLSTGADLLSKGAAMAGTAATAAYQGATSLISRIGGTESGGNYNATFGAKPGEAPQGDLSKKSLAEVMAIQASLPRGKGAIGKYQFMPSTLKDLVVKSGMNPNTTMFDAATQDKLYKIYEDGNVKQMKGYGLPINDATIKGAHYLGPKGLAVVMANTDPTLSVADVLEKNNLPANRANNKELTTMKAVDFVANMGKRMGGKGSGGTSTASTASGATAAGAGGAGGLLSSLMGGASSLLSGGGDMIGDILSGKGFSGITNTLGEAYESAKANAKSSPIAAAMVDVLGALGGDIARSSAGFQAAQANLGVSGSPYDSELTSKDNQLHHTLLQMNDVMKTMSQREDPVKNLMHGPERDRMIQDYFRDFSYPRF